MTKRGIATMLVISLFLLALPTVSAHWITFVNCKDLAEGKFTPQVWFTHDEPVCFYGGRFETNPAEILLENNQTKKVRFLTVSAMNGMISSSQGYYFTDFDPGFYHFAGNCADLRGCVNQDGIYGCKPSDTSCQLAIFSGQKGDCQEIEGYRDTDADNDNWSDYCDAFPTETLEQMDIDLDTIGNKLDFSDFDFLETRVKSIDILEGNGAMPPSNQGQSNNSQEGTNNTAIVPGTELPSPGESPNNSSEEPNTEQPANNTEQIPTAENPTNTSNSSGEEPETEQGINNTGQVPTSENSANSTNQSNSSEAALTQQPPTNPGSYGGGGSSPARIYTPVANSSRNASYDNPVFPGKECTPEYECDFWSECTDGYQNRSCSIINGCLNEKNPPALERACAANASQQNLSIPSNPDAAPPSSADNLITGYSVQNLGTQGNKAPAVAAILFLLIAGIALLGYKRARAGKKAKTGK